MLEDDRKREKKLNKNLVTALPCCRLLLRPQVREGGRQRALHGRRVRVLRAEAAAGAAPRPGRAGARAAAPAAGAHGQAAGG